MSDNIKKESAYLKRIQTNFIGQQVIAVYYEEINYEMDVDYWHLFQDIHSVDMSLILKLQSGKFLQIIWDNEFSCYGIGFQEIEKLNQREGFKITEVSQEENWKSLVGETITSIDMYWDKGESQEFSSYLGGIITKRKTKQFKLPLTWKLNFQFKHVYISAFEISENGEHYYGADHLTVFFKAEDVKKYQVD